MKQCWAVYVALPLYLRLWPESNNTLFTRMYTLCKTLSSPCNPWLRCECWTTVREALDSCISSKLTAVSQRSGFPSFWLRAWIWQELIMMSVTSVFYQRYDSSSSLLGKNCQASIPWTPKQAGVRVCLTHSTRTPSLFTFHSEDLKKREKRRFLLYQFELRRGKKKC